MTGIKGVVLGDNVFPTDAKVVISENRIRNIPDLIFKLDNSMEYGEYMDKIIDEVIKKDSEKNDMD